GLASSSSGFHTCRVLDDGSLKCWGANGSSQVGLGDTTNRGSSAGQMGTALPKVSLGTSQIAIAVTTGSSYTCALLSTGSVKCWGANSAGQLGLGTTTTLRDGA